MAAANSALITRQPDASRAPHTIGVKVDDDRSCNPARDEVDVAGERVGIACRDSVQQNSVPSIVAEEAVTPGFAVGRFLPVIQGNRKGQCGRHLSIGVISHDGLIPDPNENSVVVGPWTMCATVTPSPALRSGC